MSDSYLIIVTEVTLRTYESRLVMSLFQLPLTNKSIMSSYHLEWMSGERRACATPVSLILCTAPSFPPTTQSGSLSTPVAFFVML